MGGIAALLHGQGPGDAGNQDHGCQRFARIVCQGSGVDRLIPQFAGLPDPVFPVDSGTEALQSLCDSIDIVFTHVGDLLKAEDAQLDECLLDCRPDTFYHLQFNANIVASRHR